jgi:hypothetical protein
MEAGIAENHLDAVPGSGIARDDAVNVVEKTLEHQMARNDILAARRCFLDPSVCPVGTDPRIWASLAV